MSARELIVEHLGLIDYQLCLEQQKSYHSEVVAGKRRDTLLLCTHPPTLTKGTSTKSEHITTSASELAERELAPIEVGRGGSITYHGPEQLLCYPILNLKHLKTDVGWYMRSLEEVIILTLANLGIKGFRIEGKTGVWVRPNTKIAFIGVKISRWCTYHGVSLNVTRCSGKFALINPCGLGDIEVTSIEEEGSHSSSQEDVAALLCKSFLEVFKFSSSS